MSNIDARFGRPGIYRATVPSLSDNDAGGLGLNSRGFIVSEGYIADNGVDSGFPVKIGGKYNSSAPTYADGDRFDLQGDVNGNTKVSLGTLIAGEDLTNDVQKVEQRFSFTQATADVQVKSGSGFLHTLTFSCADAAPTAGSIIAYDSLTETGTIIYTETFDTTAFRGYSVLIDASFSTGLYLGFTTTADVSVTASYR